MCNVDREGRRGNEVPAGHNFSRTLGRKDSEMSFELRSSASRVTRGITEGGSRMRRLERGRKHKAGHLDQREVQRKDRNQSFIKPI